MICSYRLSLSELLTRPAAELRLVGADGENDDDPEDPDDDPEGDPEEGDDKKSKKSKAKPEDPKDRKITALEEEKDRHYGLRRDAEAKVTDLEAEIARLKKDGTTDEALKTELGQVKAENAELKVKLEKALLDVAFLSDNTHKWRNPATALKLADLSKVEIDDKGVHGLASALDALSKSDPYLLAPDKSDDDEDDDDKKGDPKPKPKTGEQPGGRRQKDAAKVAADEAALRKKYPGLRR